VRELEKRYYPQRQKAKVFVHATDYGGKARTVAQAIGLSVAETELYQLRWFRKHEGIYRWHERIQKQLNECRTVFNAFGFRVVFFDRPEDLLPEALAWIPQSTVALVIDHGLCNLSEHRPDVEVLLQVHDSLVFQVNQDFSDWAGLRNELSIVIPYDDPLTIPVGFKVSEKSWGNVKRLPNERSALLPLA
jgi:DNA polymerase I-like protein with 3'-5' exonuclease and polymerase domains